MPSIIGQEDKLNDGSFLRSFSYHKLPQQLLKLSILKLDGSVFEVQIAKNATVAGLKQAVEEHFSLSSDEDQCKISWSHVWGHFCLSYKGQKLINEKTSIRPLKIQDGDELEFIRHMSITYKPAKRRSKNRSSTSGHYSMLSRSDVQEQKDQTSDHEDQYDQVDDPPMPEFKLAPFLKGWLSYSRLRGVTRSTSKGRSHSSRFSLHCLGGGGTVKL